MDYYVALPNGDPTFSHDALIEIAETAEQLGFRGIFALDHLLMPRGDLYGVVHDPLVTLAYLAARTERIRLGTACVIVAMRSPFAVAKQVATLDVLCGGRLVLGLAAGWSAAEFHNVGADFHTRGARTDEAIRLIRHLFSGSRAPFEGRHFAYGDGVFLPLPVQGAAMPILIGGDSDAALRRAARHGDMWQQSIDLGPEDFTVRVRRLRQLSGDRHVEAGGCTLVGDGTAEMADTVRAWERAGAEHLVLVFGRNGAGEYLERMRRFSRGIRPPDQRPAAGPAGLIR